jgi:hypothetical protein
MQFAAPLSPSVGRSRFSGSVRDPGRAEFRFKESLMKILHALGLAIAGCVVAAPLGFAQTSSSGSTTTPQPPAKQQADGGVSPAAGSGRYTNGAHKQATQGLPPGLSSDSSAPWNNQNRPGTHQ